MLKNASDLGLKTGELGVIWASELDAYLKPYKKVVEIDDYYVDRANGFFKNYELGYYPGYTYEEARELLRFDLGEIDKNSNICRVYEMNDVVLYNVVARGIIIVVVTGVVVGYMQVYANNQLYYDIFNNTINYKMSNANAWWLYGYAM